MTDLEVAIKSLQKVIRLSFKNKWNVHSSVGGKYGELIVTKELWKYSPLIGHNRKSHSSDINLERTDKRIEVKWGMLHHELDDYYIKTRKVPSFWGWGFSQGTQFKKDKFDYCVLLAAVKNGAYPKHIFVLKREEMKEYMRKRVAGEGGKSKTSYFLETSDNKDFFKKRRFKVLKLEKLLLDKELHKRRWKELKEDGKLK